MDDLIINSKIEERMVLRATERQIPISASFELTPLCNLNCRMCYVRCSHAECMQLGGLRSVEEWLETARQLQEAGTLFLLLTGGEPFSYPGFMHLYEALRDMGFVITLNTNGTLIGQAEATYLAARMPRRVNVTLYGASSETYNKVTGSAAAYEQTLAGIRHLLSAGVPVKMNVSLIRENVAELEDFHRIARELGIPIEVNAYMYPAFRGYKAETDQVDLKQMAFDQKVRISPEQAARAELLDDCLKLEPDLYRQKIQYMAQVYETEKDSWENPNSVQNQSRNAQQQSEDDPEPELIPCRAVRSSCWINWQGQMSPCVFLDQPAISLKDYTVAEAWQQITASREQLVMPAKCTKCKIRIFCQVCVAAACHENRVGRSMAGAMTGECTEQESGDMTERSVSVPVYLCRMTWEKLRLAYEETRVY